MQFRHLLTVAVTALFFVSCKKETSSNNGDNTLTAATYLDVSYGTDALQKMDVYLPAGRNSNTKLMIMVHGGAWALGDKTDFAAFIDTLKTRLPGYALVNINYRLSSFPNNLFPTQELDLKQAVEYIYNKRSEYSIGDNFSLIGASAGGHLSLLHAYKYQTPVKIKLVVDFFGPSDITDLYNNPGSVPQATIASIVGATPTSDPALYQQSSPVSFITNSNACPTIILQGSNDPLVNPVRQSGRLRDLLLANQVPVQYVEYPGKGHGDDWDNATYTDAFNKIQAFVATYNP